MNICAAISIHDPILNSLKDSNCATKRRRRKELRVTIDEADNFGLVLVKTAQSPSVMTNPAQYTPRYSSHISSCISNSRSQSLHSQPNAPWQGDSLERYKQLLLFYVKPHPLHLTQSPFTGEAHRFCFRPRVNQRKSLCSEPHKQTKQCLVFRITEVSTRMRVHHVDNTPTLVRFDFDEVVAHYPQLRLHSSKVS